MKNAIITILVILVLGLGGFILYDKVLKEDKSILKAVCGEGKYSIIK